MTSTAPSTQTPKADTLPWCGLERHDECPARTFHFGHRHGNRVNICRCPCHLKH